MCCHQCQTAIVWVDLDVPRLCGAGSTHDALEADHDEVALPGKMLGVEGADLRVELRCLAAGALIRLVGGACGLLDHVFNFFGLSFVEALVFGPVLRSWL